MSRVYYILGLLFTSEQPYGANIIPRLILQMRKQDEINMPWDAVLLCGSTWSEHKHHALKISCSAADNTPQRQPPEIFSSHIYTLAILFN